MQVNVKVVILALFVRTRTVCPVMAQPVSSAPHGYEQLDKGNQEAWCWMGGTTLEECPRKSSPPRCLWLCLTGVLSSSDNHEPF